MPRCVAWSECSGNTMLVRDIRFHCINHFACLLDSCRLFAYVVINADGIIGLHV